MQPSSFSLVESKEPVAKSCPQTGNTPETPEAPMVLLSPPDYLLVRTVAEGGVGRHFAVAELVVT